MDILADCVLNGVSVLAASSTRTHGKALVQSKTLHRLVLVLAQKVADFDQEVVVQDVALCLRRLQRVNQTHYRDNLDTPARTTRPRWHARSCASCLPRESSRIRPR